jgi:type II secretory pathway component PulK
MRGQRREAATVSERSGVALLVTLLVIVLLEAIVGELAYHSAISLKAARSFCRDLQHETAVDGALAAVGSRLADRSFGAEQRDLLVREGVPVIALGATECSIAAEDECGKFNVNLLTQAGPEDAEDIAEELRVLLDMVGHEGGTAERIVEFLESRMGRPAGEARVAVLSELRQVEGVTDDLLFGGVPAGGAGGSCLGRYLTCWGGGSVNVNTAPAEVLRAVLAEVDPGLAESILRERSEQPFGSIAEVSGFLGLPVEVQRGLRLRLTTRSDTYSLTVTTRAGDRAAATRAVVRTRADGTFTVAVCCRRR